VSLAAVGIVVLALVLRLWGLAQGLPYAYNVDENSHFVPEAIGFFGHGFNPGYFVNPPAFTYLLHVVLALRFGGASGVWHAYAMDPGAVFATARATGAVLGALAVWLLYRAGRRLWDPWVGLLAGGLLAVAFLPVFYGHLAVNDGPTLAPLCLSLLGTAAIVRRGARRDWLLAGAAAGLAAATKYTGAIAVVPIAGAALITLSAPGARRRALTGLAVAGGAALVAFLVANPYALADFSAFRHDLAGQNRVSAAQGKLGQAATSGWAFYLRAAGWGLGVLPVLAALGGIVLLARRERRLLWIFAPALVLFYVFMAHQSRWFGRWLMPALPVLCLLAARAGVAAVRAGAARRPRLTPALAAVVALALTGQALVHDVHTDVALARPDTRALARGWMVAHLPPGTPMLVEPIAPGSWLGDPGRSFAATPDGNRWRHVDPLAPEQHGPLLADSSRASTPYRYTSDLSAVGDEDYVRRLVPALYDALTARGVCTVVTGSTVYGRVENQAAHLPDAVAWYALLRSRGTLLYRVAPAGGAQRFDFDFSFDAYPLADERAGPEVEVWRLRGGRCGP